MKTIRLKLAERSYDIVTGKNSLDTLKRYIKKLNLGEYAYILTNPTVKGKCLGLLQKALKGSGIKTTVQTVADSEKSKSFAVFSRILKAISRYDKKRKVFVLALGGGVIGDLAGFTAAVYKRGVPYIQVPTTLLAQVDSSIGGKTGLDLDWGKNLVGSFYQPRLVLSDIRFLNSLPQKELRSGLAEVIKYALIKDRALFGYLEENIEGVFGLKYACLEHIVSRCAMIKAQIVQKDEKEKKGLRTLLNFGHTIGHAIETASGYKGYTHGEAVALGMLCACDISRKMGMLKAPVAGRTEALIRKTGLPVRIKGIKIPDLIASHYRDKKFRGKTNRFVLISDIAKARVVSNIPLEVIKLALQNRIYP